jgi:hypothetical protein
MVGRNRFGRREILSQQTRVIPNEREGSLTGRFDHAEKPRVIQASNVRIPRSARNEKDSLQCRGQFFNFRNIVPLFQ